MLVLARQKKVCISERTPQTRLKVYTKARVNDSGKEETGHRRSV